MITNSIISSIFQQTLMPSPVKVNMWKMLVKNELVQLNKKINSIFFAAEFLFCHFWHTVFSTATTYIFGQKQNILVHWGQGIIESQSARSVSYRYLRHVTHNSSLHVQIPSIIPQLIWNKQGIYKQHRVPKAIKPQKK